MLRIMEKITHKFDLPCMDGRKSFYGKAHILETDDGYYLESYGTIICYIDKDGHHTNGEYVHAKFIRIWGGYSVTTMRHVNSFMKFVGLPTCGGKKWWDELEPDKTYTVSELVNLI